MKNYYDNAQTPPQDIHSSVSKSNGSVKETVMPQNPSAAAMDVRYEVAFRIGKQVPEVQALFTQLEGRFLRVWTVVPERDEAVYKKVHVQQMEIVRAFDGMEFEFNVIPSLGKSPKDAVPDPGCTMVYKK